MQAVYLTVVCVVVRAGGNGHHLLPGHVPEDPQVQGLRRHVFLRHFLPAWSHFDHRC